MGTLSNAAMAQMESDKPWFSAMSAEDRSWVGMVAQAGIKAFIEWFQEQPEDVVGAAADPGIADAVFGVAPRALAGVVTLEQTVELVRLTIDVVETHLDQLLEPQAAQLVHLGVLRYGRELAFATAEVYARAAELRGAWDARLEALVVDSVLRSDRDPTMLGRASALGWEGKGDVVVVLGPAPAGEPVETFQRVRRTSRSRGLDALCAMHGERMVIVLGGVKEPLADAQCIVPHFADGPIVVGPRAEGLDTAHRSALAAVAAEQVATVWPGAPGRSSRTTCSPSGCWPVSSSPVNSWWPGSTTCCAMLAGPCWRPSTPGSPRTARSRPPGGRSSCIPTPCVIDCARSPISPGSPHRPARCSHHGHRTDTGQVATRLGQQPGTSN